MGHGEGHRVPALAAVALLLATTVRAQEPPDVAVSGQSPEPARLEASGESDLSTSAHLGKAVTSVAFPGSPVATEPRDPPQDPQEPPQDPGDPRDPPPGGDSGPESGSESSDPRGGQRRGPFPDGPSQSSESEEGM